MYKLPLGSKKPRTLAGNVSIVEENATNGPDPLPTTAKLIRDLNPPPTTMNMIVTTAWRIMALRGVLRVLLCLPNIAGRYPSFPAT